MQASDIKAVTIPTTGLFKRTAVICAALLIITSVVPDHGQFDTGYAMNFSDTDYNDFYEFNNIVVDDEGFVSKTMPQSGEYDRSELNDKFVHTVSSGENLSLIAQQYGLKKVSTLIWENNLNNTGTIRVGQKLVIPPTDGISHKIAKGETLEVIAKKYGVEAEKIAKQNNITEGAGLKAGESIYIPSGKKIEPPKPKYIATSSSSSSGAVPSITRVSSVPQGSKPFIFPTSGEITQAFHSGHYAHDIGNRSKPHIWAAGAGTVATVDAGGWGGGYGTHVIIDHGNGVQTLYAHMSSAYVSVGQRVEQGEVLGRMGNTGRVYGPTGIHLHFEVRVNGVKKNPWLYY